MEDCKEVPRLWGLDSGFGMKAEVTKHSEYSMQMIGMAETGMTMMGGVVGGAVKKFTFTNRSYF